jgi:cysteine protease ATG4
MLLANSFLRSKIGSINTSEKLLYKDYYNVVSFFQDHPANLFSLQRLLQFYPIYDKTPGDWIGPYQFGDLVTYFGSTIKKLYSVDYVFAGNGYLDQNRIPYLDKCKYLVNIPVRLGLDEIDQVYYNNILHLTHLDSFMGIVGGNNNKSYYIVGSNGDRLIYLDPHMCQPYCGDPFSLESYSSDQVNYLPISDLSPTLSLCFYLESEEQIQEFINSPSNLPTPEYPLFEISFGERKIVETTVTSISSEDDEWSMVDTV